MHYENLLVDLDNKESYESFAKKYNMLVRRLFEVKQAVREDDDSDLLPMTIELLHLSYAERRALMESMILKAGRDYRRGDWFAFNVAPIVTAYAFSEDEYKLMDVIALAIVNRKIADHQCDQCGDHKSDIDAKFCVDCELSQATLEGLQEIKSAPSLFGKINDLYEEYMLEMRGE